MWWHDWSPAWSITETSLSPAPLLAVRVAVIPCGQPDGAPPLGARNRRDLPTIGVDVWTGHGAGPACSPVVRRGHAGVTRGRVGCAGQTNRTEGGGEHHAGTVIRRARHRAHGASSDPGDADLRQHQL